MLDDFRKVLSFFPPGDRYRILALLLSTTASGLVQAIGIASIMPFIAVVANPGLVEENRHLAWAFDALGFTSTREFLLFLGGAAFVVLLATNLLVGLNAWLTYRVCHLGEHDLARRLLRNYLTRPYVDLLQRNSSELIKMLVTEIDRVVIGTLMAGIGVFADLVTTIFIVGLLLLVNPGVTFATLLVLSAAYLLVYRWIIPKIVHLGAEFPALSTEIYKNAQEALGAVKEVKVLGREEHFVGRFSRPLLRSSRNAVAYDTLDLVPSQGLELVAFGGLVVATVYMVGHAQETSAVLATIAMFAFAAYRLIPALQGIVDGVEAIRYRSAALDVLWRDYAGGTAEAPPAAGPALRPQCQIRLSDTSFRYPGSHQDTLCAIDLVIPAGSSLCLAGPTGAGKSTAVDVLLGLLPPSGGTVTVDDTPVTADNVRAWQRNVGYVPQSIYLLDDTIASNIALGTAPEEIDADRLVRAARIAEIHDFIARQLPDGYQTVVGERGASLSGGQRQRIGIARALYRDPAVLILDEATNELDLETEARILRSLEALGDKTIVFVSHKPSVAARCDRIVVLESGRIVAQGSHEELTAPGSRYRTLLQDA